MKRSTLLLPALALVLGGLVAGCGGSDGSDGSDAGSDASSAAPTITHDDFVTQANAICTDAAAELQTAGAELTDTSTQDEVVAFITDTAIPSFQKQHDDIAALGVPEGDEDAVDTLLTSLQADIDKVAADPAAFTTATDPFAEANAAADDLGLTECGSNS
ncbi:hypothetical protein ABLE68_14680 [Nocardioides sp. CN2-186]|uniref:hypothetical protein n=1 Tax=Nocardioides tweenelious TaxID=3156607 RepID=UPI0032B41C7D